MIIQLAHILGVDLILADFQVGRNPCSDQPLSQIKLQGEKWNCFSPLSSSFSLFAPKQPR
jgi:hypothetical protein